MRLRSSSRWSRKPMLGICSLSVSLTDPFRGEEAAASGIGRYFRSRGWLGNEDRFRGRVAGNRFCGGRIDGGGFGIGFFDSFHLFGRRRVEDAVGQRSERCLEGWKDLLPGIGAASFPTDVEGIDFGLDLGAEFIGGAPELVKQARDLAG